MIGFVSFLASQNLKWSEDVAYGLPFKAAKMRCTMQLCSLYSCAPIYENSTIVIPTTNYVVINELSSSGKVQKVRT